MLYVHQRFVRPDTVEWREYQADLAKRAAEDNCVIVLPTGLGKTAVAMQLIAAYLERGAASLFLAPTRVLADQHHEYLRSTLTVEDIALVTGEEAPARRKSRWDSSVVCATPEIARNDLERGIVSAGAFGLVVLDEAHRTVGNYAYSSIARSFAAAGARIVGMTATLPSEKPKVDGMVKIIGARHVHSRDESSADVKKYVQHTKSDLVYVDLPPEMAAVQSAIKRSLDARYAELKRLGTDAGRNRSLKALLNLRAFVLAHKKAALRPLFSAIRITYALNIFEAHGTTAFLRFCERGAKKSKLAKYLCEGDEHFSNAVRLARSLQERRIEHPKIARMLEILSGSDEKAIVFSSYRDSVEVICERLASAGISAAALIGKSGEEGLKQKKQVETVARFRDGDYRVLVTTRVGEEGLDISAVDLVIFYDSVPSSIRYIQRRGRTGRRSAGRLVSLVTRDTIDQAYHWIGRRKVRTAKRVGMEVSGGLKSGLDAWQDKGA